MRLGTYRHHAFARDHEDAFVAGVFIDLVTARERAERGQDAGIGGKAKARQTHAVAPGRHAINRVLMPASANAPATRCG